MPSTTGNYSTLLTIRESRDWKEDFSSENGNYTNLCRNCKRTFTGNKNRVVCRTCNTLKDKDND